MQAERDHLVKVVFPALREALTPHRVHLVDIDLRWGVTREQAESDQSLHLCLDQIDECRPFFLGLLGERYGTIPHRLTPQVLRSHPWLANHPGRSITELEFLHGALSQPAQDGVLFCFRDPAATATVPEPFRSAAFTDPAPEAGRRLADLKDLVRSSGLPLVDGYSCSWQPEEERFVDLEEFGARVRDWLWQAIRVNLGLPDAPGEASRGEWEEETEHHERFLESSLRVFVGRQESLSSLMDFVRGSAEVPCLVTGPDGCGKTALLARFTDACRHAFPDHVILPHFAGAGPRSTSLRDMVARLSQTLHQRFGLEVETQGSRDGLAERFRELLWHIPQTARVILVLDGLDRLEGDQVHELYWLPDRLPAHVKVVVACAGETPIFQAFQRTDVRRPPHRVEVGPLGDRERLTILRQVPSLSAKSLDRQQLRTLLANPATRNPLFLTAALEELRSFGMFDRFDQRIADLPSGDRALAELFAQILRRLESDFGATLVARVLALLPMARRGLSEGELIGLTEGLPHPDNFFPLLRQLRPWLLDRGGLTAIAHRELREAICLRYLGQAGTTQREMAQRDAHRTLADYFARQPLSPRQVEELPWHLALASAWEQLRNQLADLAFFDAAWHSDAFEVKEYWAKTEAHTPLRLVDAYSVVVEQPEAHTPETLAHVAHLLADTGHLAEAVVLRRHLLILARQSAIPQRLAAALANLALLQKTLGQNESALALYAEAEGLCREHEDWQGLQRVLGNRARLLKGLGDLDGAMKLLQEQERLCRELGNRQGLQTALGNQALVLQARGDAEGALVLLAERERLCREAGNRHGLQIALSNQALLLRQLGDSHSQAAERALKCLEEAEAICRDLGNRQGLQVALGHRATILLARGCEEDAAALFTEQERLCRELGNRLGLQIALANRAMLLHTAGDSSEALTMLEDAEQLARALRNPEAVIMTLRNQAEVLAAIGRNLEADTCAEEAHTLATRHGLTAMVAWVEALR